MALFTRQPENFNLVDINYYSFLFFVMVNNILHLRKLNKYELIEIKYKFIFIKADSFPLVFSSDFSLQIFSLRSIENHSNF